MDRVERIVVRHNRLVRHQLMCARRVVQHARDHSFHTGIGCGYIVTRQEQLGRRQRQLTRAVSVATQSSQLLTEMLRGSHK